MSTPILVDTNVALAAKLISDAPESCVAKCIEKLKLILAGQHRVVIDSDGRIMGEYRHKLNHSGQPTVGDAFFKWLYSNLGNEQCCEMVDITVQDEQEQIFAEFPNVTGLEKFDRSDRKFVAVANAHPDKPPILEAWDIKWVGWSEALGRAGIKVEFVCEDEARKKFEENFGDKGKSGRVTKATQATPTPARKKKK